MPLLHHAPHNSHQVPINKGHWAGRIKSEGHWTTYQTAHFHDRHTHTKYTQYTTAQAQLTTQQCAQGCWIVGEARPKD